MIATIIIFITLLPLRIIHLFPTHKPLGLLLLKDDYGIFHVHYDLSVFSAHKGNTGTDESEQVLIQKN